jgi:hypothetical protein
VHPAGEADFKGGRPAASRLAETPLMQMGEGADEPGREPLRRARAFLSTVGAPP